MSMVAVVVGVNYVDNPEAELQGCCNDARLARDMLLDKGFAEEDIRMLVDDDDNYDRPNFPNVRAALNWLCSDREDGDVVFFHFSGHGTQVPSDGDDVETDEKDEAIVLDGIFLFCDDDIKQFFCMLPEGARATVVMDCCHSGSMLDGTEVAIDGDKRDDAGIAEYSFLERDDGSEAANREMPVTLLCQLLAEKLGDDVPPTGNGVNGALARLHGGASGKAPMRFALNELTGQSFGGAGFPMSDVAAQLLERGDIPEEVEDAEALVEERPFSFVASVMAMFGLGHSDDDARDDVGFEPEPDGVVGDVVLITGCQADETSADVRPPGGDAYGALTKTLTDLQRENGAMSNYDLVREVRSVLAEGGYSQNPCLETSDELAQDVFICE